MKANLLLATFTAAALVGAPLVGSAQESEPVPDNPDTEVNEFLESGGEISEPDPVDNPDTAENEGPSEPSPTEPTDNPDTAADESQSGGEGGASGAGDT